MAIVKGKVQKITSRDFDWGTSYSVQVNGTYYSVGKYPPKCAEGDYIKFDATQKGQYWNLSKGAKIEKVGADEAPSSPSPAPRSGGYGGGDDKRQETISKQAARNSALTFTQMALACGALDFAKTATPDKKFAILSAFVDETTDKYYNYSIGKTAKPVAEDGEEAEAPEDKEDWD